MNNIGPSFYDWYEKMLSKKCLKRLSLFQSKVSEIVDDTSVSKVE